MRHKKSGKKLGRNTSHRKALLRNMARSLLTHERIRTTESRAKALSSVMDKLVTLALKNDLHARRQAFRVLENHGLVQRLFDEVGPRFPSGGGGGYTRVIKLALPRSGDAAPMAMVELAFPGESDKPAKVEPKPAEVTTPTPDSAPAAAEAPAEPEAPAEEEAAPAEAEPPVAEETPTTEAPDPDSEKKD
jgi:large subunit ribosomal protein L17